jgi:NDP-sugar pyrophosphorylase family protein
MQIVIPMSGFGERFRRAGYNLPKPLIEVEGKPIIGHVIDMFPGETNFVFICNQDHLDEPKYNMGPTLKKLCPTGRIVGIAPHKLGPVHAVLQVEELISDEAPIIVNYCDFTCYWDWHDFKRFVRDNACVGAIPSYKGFHPHTLGSTNYAYMLESGGWVKDIQEKQPYTDNRMDEFASSGTYYFSSGHVMKEAFRQQLEDGLDLNGEFYVSLAYKKLLQQHNPIAIYPLQHFMQWGTPEDVAEYNYWSAAFNNITSNNPSMEKPQGSLVIPMAGLGQRFVDEGYDVTKPLLPVSTKPMFVQAVECLPKTERQVFVLREDMSGFLETKLSIEENYPTGSVASVASVTDGQASSALVGLDLLERNAVVEGPVTFGACDFAAVYDPGELQRLINDPKVDVIVWSIRGYPNALRTPNSYGWLNTDGLKIKSVSVKKPLANPKIDPIILGTFTFRRAEDFRNSFENLKSKNATINNEFFIDSCINEAIEAGLSCYFFEVDSYLCWGTPNDYKTFRYWQSCFHKWEGHGYRLDDDPFVELSKQHDLETDYVANFYISD